jgi:hypothetical protein
MFAPLTKEFFTDNEFILGVGITIRFPGQVGSGTMSAPYLFAFTARKLAVPKL